MFQMFRYSVRAFFRGKLFQDNGEAFRQWLKGFLLTLGLLLVVGYFFGPLAGVIVASAIGGTLQPYFFKNIKYRLTFMSSSTEPLSRAPSHEAHSSQDDLARLAGRIARLEEVAAGWDEHHAGTLAAIKSSIEELNAEAFRRLIRYLREDPAASARLNAAVRDPFIFGVLRFHGLVKDPLEVRVERALEEVRPMLREHGGDVELVAVLPPDRVEVRMVGACHGCPASAQTLTEGVERAIRTHCPEVLHVVQVSHPPREAAAASARGSAQVVHFVSPFARAKDEGWERVCALDEIPDGGILARTHDGHELMFYRRGGEVSCMTNACAHLGMPLDAGELQDGILTCPYHGFSYLLATGECLTVPEVQLTVHPVKVSERHVAVRLGEMSMPTALRVSLAPAQKRNAAALAAKPLLAPGGASVVLGALPPAQRAP